MVSAGAFILVVYLTIVSAQYEPYAEVPVPFSITQVPYTDANLIRPNAVHGAKDCGAVGRVLQCTHSNCNFSLLATCAVEINKTGNAFLYFVAGEDASDLVARTTLICEGQTKSVNVPVPDTSLTFGQSYRMYIDGKVEPALLGKLFTVRIELLRDSDKEVQVCLEISYLGVKSDSEN